MTEHIAIKRALPPHRFTDTSLESALQRRDVTVSAWVRRHWADCEVARAIAEHAVGAALAKVGR